MSTGPFINSVYSSGDGTNFHSIRIQPETLGLDIGGTANAAPAGPVNSQRGVSASGKRSILFITARRVNVRVTGAGTSGFEVGSVLSVPWLQPGTFFDVTVPRAQTGTYNGATIEVIGSSPERL